MVAVVAGSAVVSVGRADGRACCWPRSKRAGHLPPASKVATMVSKLSAAASSRSNVEQHSKQVYSRCLVSYVFHSR